MRESSAGYHFMNLFQNCPWKFYIKYIMGLTPEYSSPALLFGAAIHVGVAAFLLGKDYQTEFRKAMHEEKDGYQKEEEYTLDQNRGVVLLATWASEVGQGFLSDNHVLAAEGEIEVSLRNGYQVTARPDACFTPKSRRSASRPEVYILETKTTRWGRDLVEETLQNADQITTYIWAVKKNHPEWKVIGVVPNVMYQNKSKIGVGLGDIIFRTDKDILNYEEQVMGLLVEISQKVLALKEGKFNHLALFPRNTSWCGSYNKPCEYMSICRKNMTESVPSGFKRENWGERDAIESVPVEVPDEKKTPSTFGLYDYRPAHVIQSDDRAQYSIDFGDNVGQPTGFLGSLPNHIHDDGSDRRKRAEDLRDSGSISDGRVRYEGPTPSVADE